MTVVQVIMYQLQGKCDNEGLVMDKDHDEALRNLEEMEGGQNLVWSVMEEDASRLVWLVGKCCHFVSSRYRFFPHFFMLVELI
jgi:hypothetical protein